MDYDGDGYIYSILEDIGLGWTILETAPAMFTSMAAFAKYRAGELNSRNWLPHSCRGQKAEIRAPAAPCSL